MSNKHHRSAWWPTVRHAVRTTLLGILLVPFITTPVHAAGESYSWKDSDSVALSGGSVVESTELYASGDSLSGTFKIFQSSERHCTARVGLTLAADRKSAKYFLAVVNSETSAPGGSSLSCTDSEVSTIEAYAGTTATISGSQGGTTGGTETSPQRRIKVSIVNNGAKANSPNSVHVILKNNAGNTVKEIDLNIDDDGWYYGSFSNVNPGQYTACVKQRGNIAAACDDVKKVKYEVAQVTVGEASSTAKITVKLKANVTPTDPTKDQTFGPFNIELRKDGAAVKSKSVEALYAADGCNASPEACGGSVNAYETFNFNNIAAGDYKVCMGERCVDAKKVEGVALQVTLAVNQEDINNVIPPDEATTSCAIDNIGWLVCPVLGFMARIVDVAYGQVASWLNVTPLSTTAPTGGGSNTMYSAWGIMRNIANLSFVVAFMIIIYSQLTSVGLSNYGIKKLLPKIVMAAILVNLSYWVCAVAVDLSNIAGASLYKLFDAEVFSQGLDTSQFAGDVSSSGNGWTGLVAALLGSAALYVALPALIVALPAALFAIVTVFLVLALRQVLIILLVVISPLAFVALLLPNTEDLFKKWRTLFQTLLLLYPIVAVIFGASAMASTIVMNSATDIEGDGKVAVQLMGALITILPLAITPIVLKFGGGLLNRFGGIVNNPNKGPFDSLRKRADGLANWERGRRRIGGLQGKGISKVTGMPTRFGMRRKAQGEAMEAKVKAAEAIYGSTSPTAARYGQQKADAEAAAKAANVNLEASAVEMRSVDEITAHNIANARLDSANRQKQSEYVDRLVNDDGSPTGIASSAGGIQVGGAQRVAAAAKAAQTKEMIESIDNYQNTLPFDVTSDVSQLRTRFNNPDISMTERVAYARAMRNNGSPGVIALEEELVNLTGDSGQWSASTVQANPDTKKDLLTFKEIMREDKGFQTASRSFEVWANNEKVGDGQGGKRDYTSFGEALDRTDVFETVSAQRFASQSENVRVDQLKKLKALPDDTKYKEFIRRIARDSTAMGNIKGTAQDIILESVKQYGMED